MYATAISSGSTEPRATDCLARADHEWSRRLRVAEQRDELAPSNVEHGLPPIASAAKKKTLVVSQA